MAEENSHVWGENMTGLLFWERHYFYVGFEGVQKLREGFLFGEEGEVIPYRGAKGRKGAEAFSIVPNRHVIRCRHGCLKEDLFASMLHLLIPETQSEAVNTKLMCLVIFQTACASPTWRHRTTWGAGPTPAWRWMASWGSRPRVVSTTSTLREVSAPCLFLCHFPADSTGSDELENGQGSGVRLFHHEFHWLRVGRDCSWEEGDVQNCVWVFLG